MSSPSELVHRTRRKTLRLVQSFQNTSLIIIVSPYVTAMGSLGLRVDTVLKVGLPRYYSPRHGHPGTVRNNAAGWVASPGRRPSAFSIGPRPRSFRGVQTVCNTTTNAHFEHWMAPYLLFFARRNEVNQSGFPVGRHEFVVLP